MLLLNEIERITITICEQVIAETERTLARKAPQAVAYYHEAVRSGGIKLVHDPAPEQVKLYAGIIADPADVPIVVAAMQAKVDFLVTLKRRHFMDDPQVALRAGLLICTPGDALAWVRPRLSAAVGEWTGET